MINIRNFFITALVLCCARSSAQVLIKGNIRANDTIHLQYFEPFEDFANDFLVTIDHKKFAENFVLHPVISQPTMVRFIVDQHRFDLLCEPQDTISLTIGSPTKEPDAWLQVEGTNAEGISYYNQVYNKVLITKYEEIGAVFEKFYLQDNQLLLQEITKELQRQTAWADSLYEERKVTQSFRDYISTEINSTLAWELVNLCNHYLESDPNRVDLIAKSVAIKQGLFEIVDPLDDKLSTCSFLCTSISMG